LDLIAFSDSGRTGLFWLPLVGVFLAGKNEV